MGAIKAIKMRKVQLLPSEELNKKLVLNLIFMARAISYRTVANGSHKTMIRR